MSCSSKNNPSTIPLVLVYMIDLTHRQNIESSWLNRLDVRHRFKLRLRYQYRSVLTVWFHLLWCSRVHQTDHRQNRSHEDKHNQEKPSHILQNNVIWNNEFITHSLNKEISLAGSNRRSIENTFLGPNPPIKTRMKEDKASRISPGVYKNLLLLFLEQ